MPIGYVFVRDSRCDVKHNDTTLAVDVVAIAESPEFLLSGRVPDIKLYATIILFFLSAKNVGSRLCADRCKGKRMDLDT